VNGVIVITFIREAALSLIPAQSGWQNAYPTLCEISLEATEKRHFCWKVATVPSPWGGVGGLSPTNETPIPPNWNM